MPTYDYECDDCKRVYEVRQPISAEPLTTCQHCGGRVRRLLSATPFILKGGGWYVTDYPSESRKKAMEAEKKSSDPGGKSSDSGGKSSDSGGKSSDAGGTAKPSDGGGASSPSSTSSTSTTPSTSEGPTKS